MKSIDGLVRVRSSQYVQIRAAAAAAANDVDKYDERRPWLLAGRPLTLRAAAELVQQAPEMLDQLRPRGDERTGQTVASFFSKLNFGWEKADTGHESFTGRLGNALSLSEITQIMANVLTATQQALGGSDGERETLFQLRTSHRSHEHPVYLAIRSHKHQQRKGSTTLKNSAWLYSFPSDRLAVFNTPEDEGQAHAATSELGEVLSQLRERGTWLSTSCVVRVMSEEQKSGDEDALAPVVLSVVEPLLQLANDG